MTSTSDSVVITCASRAKAPSGLRTRSRRGPSDARPRVTSSPPEDTIDPDNDRSADERLGDQARCQIGRIRSRWRRGGRRRLGEVENADRLAAVTARLSAAGASSSSPAEITTSPTSSPRCGPRTSGAGSRRLVTAIRDRDDDVSAAEQGDAGIGDFRLLRRPDGSWDVLGPPRRRACAPSPTTSSSAGPASWRRDARRASGPSPTTTGPPRCSISSPAAPAVPGPLLPPGCDWAGIHARSAGGTHGPRDEPLREQPRRAGTPDDAAAAVDRCSRTASMNDDRCRHGEHGRRRCGHGRRRPCRHPRGPGRAETRQPGLGPTSARRSAGFSAWPTTISAAPLRIGDRGHRR